jgi:hypothetical protein
MDRQVGLGACGFNSWILYPAKRRRSVTRGVYGFMTSSRSQSFLAWAGLAIYLAGYWKSARQSGFWFHSLAIQEKASPGNLSHAFPVAG